MKLFEFNKAKINTLTNNINKLKSYFGNEANECEKLVEEQKDQSCQPVYLLFKSTGLQSDIKKVEVANNKNKIPNFILSTLMEEYILRGECSIEGKEFISNSIDLIIQPNSVKEATMFWIKKYNGLFNYPLKTENDLKLNALEIGCDSKLETFEIPVILRYKNIDVKHSNICLFKQQINNDEINKQKWTLHFPTKRENETVEFELKSFSIVFLSVSRFLKHIECSREYQLNLEEYQKIKPGLNFRIKCIAPECKELLIITQMGYGNFEYSEVPSDNTRQFSDYCSRCLKRFNIENICSMIFFKSKFNIRFHTTGSSNLEIKTFENNLFFIWNTRLTETYSYLAIQVDPREIEILNANIYARLDIAEFQKLDVPQMTYADYPIKGSYYS